VDYYQEKQDYAHFKDCQFKSYDIEYRISYSDWQYPLSAQHTDKPDYVLLSPPAESRDFPYLKLKQYELEDRELQDSRGYQHYGYPPYHTAIQRANGSVIDFPPGQEVPPCINLTRNVTVNGSDQVVEVQNPNCTYRVPLEGESAVDPPEGLQWAKLYDARSWRARYSAKYG
jgi:hypothetical protein